MAKKTIQWPKKKRTNGQTILFKTLHSKLNSKPLNTHRHGWE
jgi:hypothetical protein